MTDAEIALLEDVAVGHPKATRPGQIVQVQVNGAAYSCCGKGWRRRDGYLQKYRGYVDNLQLPEGEAAGTFMLYSQGIGTMTYVVALRFFEVEEVVLGAASWPAHW